MPCKQTTTSLQKAQMSDFLVEKDKEKQHKHKLVYVSAGLHFYVNKDVKRSKLFRIW